MLGTIGSLVADSAETTGLKWVSAGVGCYAYNSTGTTLTSGVYTTINLNSEYFDVGGFHSTSSNTSRMTIPSGQAGIYVVTGNVQFYSLTACDIIIRILLNGNQKNEVQYRHDGTGSIGMLVTQFFNLAVNDYLELAVYQNSGTNKTGETSTYGGFGLVKIGI